VHLACDAPDIGGEIVVDSLRRTGQRRGVHQREMRIFDGQPLFQKVQHALALDQLVELACDFGLPVGGIAGFQLFERLALGGLEELPEQLGIEREGCVKIGAVADPIGAGLRAAALEVFCRRAGQVPFNGLFQRDFLGVADCIIYDRPLK